MAGTATVNADAAVIGAGPSGCATALALARQGKEVVLLDAQAQGKRLAGEWLHPPALNVLRELQVDLLESSDGFAVGRGFVVIPEDGTAPIILSYPNGAVGVSCEHQALVTTLRQATVREPRIRQIFGARVTQVGGGKLTFSLEGAAAPQVVQTPLIVGADGRSSMVRRSLGLSEARRLLSFMAGVTLEDVELPFEGYGHLYLGGPGPIFIVRIGPRHLRAFCDVPVAMARPLRDPQELLRHYAPILPAEFQPALVRAIAAQPVVWVANHWRPRLDFGRPDIMLVGDAVGYFHPLTAVGMTMGIMDGYELAQSSSLPDYRRVRRSASMVPEFLCAGLYEVFTGKEEGTIAMRQAVYDLWRKSPYEARRTMRLLSGEETNFFSFNTTIARVIGRAVRRLVRDAAFSGQWQEAGRALLDIGGWIAWLACGNLPCSLLAGSNTNTTTTAHASVEDAIAV